jgi:hypothetical protein
MGPHGGAGPGDQHVIGSRLAFLRQDSSRQSSQPPFCTIAGDGITYLSACGEPHSHRRVATRRVCPPRSLEDQALCHRPAAGGCDTQKIGAGLERYKPAAHRNSGLGRLLRDRAITRTTVCDPLPAAKPTPCARRPSPCAPENRDGVSERGCWAGKSASRLRLQITTSLGGGGYIGVPMRQVNDSPGSARKTKSILGGLNAP